MTLPAWARSASRTLLRRSILCAITLVMQLSPVLVSAKGSDRSDAPIPAWRGEVPGTAWLGADVLWRSREWLIFHLQEETGGGFVLDLTIRDLNTYMQGERPVVGLVPM